MRVRTLALLALGVPAAAKNDYNDGYICHVPVEFKSGFSKLHVDGELNGHTIELDKKETARPAGTVMLKMSSPCPSTAADLVDPFTFEVDSMEPILVLPQEDLTIKASVVKIQVDKLQLEFTTTNPINSKNSEFATPNGLHMKVVRGTATALKHSFDLTGFETDVPFNGYFDYSDLTGELTLHIIDFDAQFVVEVHKEDLDIQGSFRVQGWISALGSVHPGSLRAAGAALEDGWEGPARAALPVLLVVAAAALAAAFAASFARRPLQSSAARDAPTARLRPEKGPRDDSASAFHATAGLTRSASEVAKADDQSPLPRA